MSRKREKKREQHAVVLDYLRNGHIEGGSRDPLVQVVGKGQFTLLELVPKQGEEFELLDDVYVGGKDRPRIKHVKRRISYDDLTSTAKGELKHALKQIVLEKEEEYVDFFNNARALSTRTHLLQMLPGVGKKHMQQIVEERRVENFTSFKDLKERVSSMKKPADLIVGRILSELEGKEKNFLFAKR